MTHELEEGDRQAIVLAIARLSVERPGWLNFLRGIAGKLNGEAIFDAFRKHKLDERGANEHQSS